MSIAMTPDFAPPLSRTAWLLALLTPVLAGCTTITTHKTTGEAIVMTPEAFEKYVEHVFRYHNQVMSELIAAGDERPDQPRDEDRRLSAAEKKMITACQPLNEVVSESLSGENVGLQMRLDLVETVPACEEASKAVEELMP